MLHRLALALAAFAFGLGVYLPSANAQVAQVIASCGTPPRTPTLGAVVNLFIDQNGNLCSNASIGSITIGSVTQGPGNAANPWTVAFQAGSTVIAKIQDSGGSTLNSTSGALNANLFAGGTAAGTAGNPLVVSLSAGVTIGTVIQGTQGSSGSPWFVTNGGTMTVTANAGTNLNTSALALESGGNLATLAATVSGGSVKVSVQGTPAVTATDNITQIAGSSIATAATGIIKVGLTDASGNATAAVASALEVNLRNSSGTEIGTTTNPVTVTVNGSGSGATTVTDPVLESAVKLGRVNVNISSMTPLAHLSDSIDFIGGWPLQFGQQLSKLSLPVVVASDQTVTITGTVQGIVGGVALQDNLVQIGSNSVLTAGVNGTLAIGGNQTTGAPLSTEVFPIRIAGEDYSGTPNIHDWKVDLNGIGYINCSNCTGTGVSQTDESVFSPGISSFVTDGGFYQLNPLSNPLTNLQMGTYQLTQYRAEFVNLRDTTGAEVGVGARPLFVQGPLLASQIATALQTGPQIAANSLSVTVAWNQRPIPVTLPNATPANPIPVAPAASPSGGADVVSLQVANNTTAVSVCAGPCTLYGTIPTNNSANIAYIKMYNSALAGVTCGSGTPKDRLLIPASASGAGVVAQPGAPGVSYTVALTVCVTSGYSDSDTTAPAANVYTVSFYKK